WLVEQQDLRIVGKRTGDGRALLHAARQLLGPVVLEAAQADLVDIAVDDLPHFLRRNAAFAKPEGDVLANGEPRKQGIGLEHHATVGAGPLDFRAFQRDGAGGRTVEPGDDPQKRRLSAAGRAQNGDEVVLLDRQVGGLQRLHGLSAVHAGKGPADTLDDQFTHASLQAKSFLFRLLNAKSEIRPMRPMTMMPKMIWPVAISAWLLMIM